MSFMTNSSKILKKLLHIIFLPFKGIKRLITFIFRSLHFSIRRKIALNYLVLYLVVSIMTYILVIGGFLLVELSEKGYEVNVYVDNLMEKYELGIMDLDELEYSINTLSEMKDCGIKLVLRDNVNVNSTLYNEYYDFHGLLENINLFVNDGLYQSEFFIHYKDPITGKQEVGNLTLVFSLEDMYQYVHRLSTMYIIATIFGFIFIWIFGSLNIRGILRPIYTMTKTAEKISISNCNELLDVNQAKYELKDLAITLNDMIERLQKDYEKQKQFVSDVSHELRTPISILSGYANMLKRWGKEDEEILDESIEALSSEAKNMQILVENLLTLVRSDNQTLQFNKEEFYLDELIKEVVKETQMINTKNQEITCNLENPIKVYMDFQMIKQTLRIFVDNAVKYTPEMGTIYLKGYSKDGYGYIHIVDSGIGIEKSDLSRIFDRFYRSDESRTRQTGGHGLGLSIAKAIILGHGGKIKVKSKVNEGTEIIAILPL